MKILSKKEFAEIREDYKGVCLGRDIPEWKGRRTVFLPGEGTTLSVEGVHFLVIDDYSHLPALHKGNARIGDSYLFCDKVAMVLNIYRLSDEEAKAKDLMYVDRVTTTIGDYVLPGSDLRSDLIKK